MSTNDWYACKQACLRAVRGVVCQGTQGWTMLVAEFDVERAIQRVYPPSAPEPIPYPILVERLGDLFWAGVPALGMACSATGWTQADAVDNLVYEYSKLRYALEETGRTVEDVEELVKEAAG